MPTTITITTDLSNPANIYTELNTVGTRYECGINGDGFMLWDRTITDPELVYRRQTVPLDPQKFATNETPFSEAIERYYFLSFTDFSSGAGQRRFNRESSVPNRFWDSDGVNPFEQNQLTLLHEVTRTASTHTDQRFVVVGTDIYIQTGAKQITKYSTVGGSGTAFSIAAATTIVDLTTDGTYWYAAAGAAGIFRNNSAADPGAAWSAQRAFIIGWQAQRICAGVDSTGSGTVPNRFTTLNSGGTEEVGSGRLTFNTNQTITNFTGGSGYVWFGVYAGNTGSVYRWDLTVATPVEALPMPTSQAVRQVYWYQGQILVRAEDRSSSTVAKALIYRCPVSDTGTVSLFLLVELDDALVDHGPGVFASDDRFVFFTWMKIDGTNAGIGCIDLSSGGYSKWHKGIANDDVRAIGLWQNRLAFCVDGSGLYVEDPTTYLATGYIETSISDSASTLDKVYDYITIACEPIDTSESIDIAYTFESGTSYTTFAAASIMSSGTRKKKTAFALKASSIGVKVTLNGGGTTTPTLQLVQLQLHPVGLADTIWQLPVNCMDELSDMNGTLISAGPNSGADRARQLEALVQSRILWQDIDYQATTDAKVVEVVQADVRSVHMNNPHTGTTAIGQVCVLMLRQAAR